MNHPSDFYIKYLCVRGRHEGKRLRFEHIQKILKTFRLPVMDEGHYKELVDALVIPRGLRFDDHSHGLTQRFMFTERIHTLWITTADSAAMFELITLPQIQETVQMLLIGRVPKAVLTKKVNERYKTNFSEKTITMYEHFFWNTERISTEEWEKHLVGYPQMWSYLTSLACSPNQALFRAGFNPLVNRKKVLADAFLNLAMRTEATRTFRDTPKVVASLARLTTQLVHVHDALNSDGSGLEEAMASLSKFKIERAAQQNKSLDELTSEGDPDAAVH